MADHNSAASNKPKAVCTQTKKSCKIFLACGKLQRSMVTVNIFKCKGDIFQQIVEHPKALLFSRSVSVKVTNSVLFASHISDSGLAYPPG